MPIRAPARSAPGPLHTLLEATRGKALVLPPRLARLYGNLRIPQPRDGPHVISNFVTTLDGVVSFNIPGHASGGDISGFSSQDRMVMGLLRAIADVVIVGAGTLGADPRHVWTAEAICPEFAGEYRRLRQELRKPVAPLNVVVSGSGELDLRLPIFASGKVPSLIVTTPGGAKRLAQQNVSHAVGIRVIRGDRRTIPASTILRACTRCVPAKVVLIEGGPQLMGAFYEQRLIDEQFLTLAPQIVGRMPADHRLSMVMGKLFTPREARWGTLVDARDGRGNLFLRYALRAVRAAQRPAR
jgi:riboflavin biosynthesis pyrimidine reductase